MRDYYVYTHHRKSDGSIFYVGKGKGPRASSLEGRNIHWKRVAKKHGWTAKIYAGSLSEDCALSIEAMLIHIFKSKIANIMPGMTPGGRSHAPETKEKLKQKAAIQWANPEAVEARRLATLRQWQEPGMRERLSQAAKKRFLDPEQREKVSQFHSGRKQSPERAAKSRIAKLGKLVTEETRQKLRDAWVIRKAKNAAK